MTHTVTVHFFAYAPPNLTITAGDSVQWTNADGMMHTATREDAPPFDTGEIGAGSTSAPIPFLNASPAEGLEYFCRPHPHMKGTIIVNAAAPGAAECA